MIGFRKGSGFPCQFRWEAALQAVDADAHDDPFEVAAFQAAQSLCQDAADFQISFIDIVNPFDAQLFPADFFQHPVGEHRRDGGDMGDLGKRKIRTEGIGEVDAGTLRRFKSPAVAPSAAGLPIRQDGGGGVSVIQGAAVIVGGIHGVQHLQEKLVLRNSGCGKFFPNEFFGKNIGG